MGLRIGAGLLGLALSGCDARTRYDIGTFVGQRAAVFETAAIVLFTAIVALVAWRLALSSRRRRKAIDDAMSE
jgi:hypothetical protein